MDNTVQSHNICSLNSNPPGARANMYFIQVKSDNAEGLIDTETIPLQMLINEQDAENERYLISVVEPKHLQLLIDPQDQYGTSTTTHYALTPGLQVNTDISNSLPIPNNLEYRNTLAVTEHAENFLSETLSNSVKVDKKDNNINRVDYNSRKVINKFVHIPDRVAPARAAAVLPAALRLRRAAVSPRRPLPARVRFGPLEGISRKVSITEAESLVSESASSRLPVFLVKTDDGSVIHVDGSDKDKSNWLTLLPLGGQSSANVWLCQEEGRLYAVTTQPIAARTALALGYSKEYAEAHGIPDGQPVLDIDAELTKHRKWWCAECQRALPSAALLRRHGAAHRPEENQRSQRRYRCKHCTRTFCRLFTLRRHVSRHCTSIDKEEKRNKSSEAINGLMDVPELLSTSNAEGLQALGGLELAALLGGERAPGSSRSDSDSNPYSLGFKDVGFAGMEFPSEAECVVKKEVCPDADKVFLNCRHCDQTVVKGKQRQHTKVCPGRKLFQCECGRSFPYRDKLALHLRRDHGDDLAALKQKNATKEADNEEYRCETCKHPFKRRGMLVNHLWRVHGQSASGVPLSRRERLFPCAACPKLYRSAAKRARHAAARHPGCELPVAPAVEGGRRACEPAACAACPRQYATRAKLLQHVRARHPLLASPVKRSG